MLQPTGRPAHGTCKVLVCACTKGKCSACLDGHQLVSLLLKTLYDVCDESALHAVWLDLQQQKWINCNYTSETLQIDCALLAGAHHDE